MLLAIDTCLSQCGVALGEPETVRVERHRAMRRGQAEALLPMIEDALAAAGVEPSALTGIVVTIGPGSFTGVRVGIAAARGLALACACPAAGVTTLEALAAAARERCPQMPVLVAITGRGGQLYHQAFDDAGRPEGPPALAERETVAAHYGGRESLLAGSGAEALAAEASGLVPLIGLETPPPATLLRLAGQLAPQRWEALPAPLYLRAPDAKPAAGQSRQASG